MSDTKPLSELLDFTADTSGIVSGSSADASEVLAAINDLRDRVDQLNDAIVDEANNRAGTAPPTDNTVEGQIQCDTTTDPAIMKYDPDGSGVDTALVDVASVQTITGIKTLPSDTVFNTGGSETHKPMGVIDTQFVSVPRTTAGTLMTYTLPANTLDANGKAVRITAWGTKTNANALCSFEFNWGGTQRGLHNISQSATAWRVVVIISRVSAGNQTLMSENLGARDLGWNAGDAAADGDIDVDVSAPAEDETATQVIDFEILSINASDTVTQDGMLIEVLN